MSDGMGPPAQALSHRLAQCPSDFLDDPVVNGKGKIHTAAVVSDLFLDMGRAVLSPEEESRVNKPSGAARKTHNRLRMIQVASWLIAYPWFSDRKDLCDRIFDFLADGLDELAEYIDAAMFVTDPDRREEISRLLLAALELTPEGETGAQASDRLGSLNSVERHKVLEETKKAEARARKVREELARKAAQEAASKATRE